MKFTERIVQSYGYPPSQNDLWLDLSDGTLKYYDGGEWKSVAGSSGSDDSGSGSGAVTQIQADWEQTDDTKADYIKNKPTIPSGSSSFVVVKGSFVGEGDVFEPNEGEMTYAEAVDFLLDGGVIVAVSTDGETYYYARYSSSYYDDSIMFNSDTFWYPDED